MSDKSITEGKNTEIPNNNHDKKPMSDKSITKGKIANIIISSEIESINDLPYFYGDNLVDKILINGEEII